MLRDPVCGKRINSNKAYVQIVYEGSVYYLCCPLCQGKFEKDPKKYVKQKINRHKQK